jgi:hypothetical protein
MQHCTDQWDVCVVCAWPANPESLLRVMEDLLSKSSTPQTSNLEIFDLYEMTGQAGDADKVLPTLVKANPKL